MPTGAALSEHPLATHALGECVGHLLEVGGPRPDLLVVMSTAAHAGALEDIAAAARELLAPEVLIGASAASVLGGELEVEERPALAMFAVWDVGDAVRPVRIADGAAALEGVAGTLVLVGDPFTCDPEVLVDQLAEAAPQLTVVGGMASAARHRGGNRLLLDDRWFTDGAVGVVLGPAARVTAVVSQGCRPVGVPMTVTAGEHRVVRELAGRPALDLLREVVAGLPPEDQLRAAPGLLLGRVVDEQRDEFAPGDFLVRSVLGADPDNGALALAEGCEVGTTVQFHVRDATTAHQDLVETLQGRTASGALVFTSTGRGAALFPTPDHDAAAIAESLDTPSIAGMFSAGELGPVGGRNAAHTMSAAVLLVD